MQNNNKPSTRQSTKNERSGDSTSEPAKGTVYAYPHRVRVLTIYQATTAHNEETPKLRAAKESLEATQITAWKKQEAELERPRTQPSFKQHEIEASRKARLPPPRNN